MNILLKDKVQGSLVGFYIGDALAMPVHWYYDLRQLVSDFGSNGITKYESPKVSLVTQSYPSLTPDEIETISWKYSQSIQYWGWRSRI